MEDRLKAVKEDLLYLNRRLDKLLDDMSRYQEEGDLYSYELALDFIKLIKNSLDRIFSRYVDMYDVQDNYVELLVEFISFKMKDFI